MTGLVPSVHMETPRKSEKKSIRNTSFKKELQGGKERQGLREDEVRRKNSFRNKSFKKELQGEKERQGLREDEIRRKLASGIRASKKGFKGKKSVRVCAKTKFAEKELQE